MSSVEIERAGSIAVHTQRPKRRYDISVLSASIVVGSEVRMLGG